MATAWVVEGAAGGNLANLSFSELVAPRWHRRQEPCVVRQGLLSKQGLWEEGSTPTLVLGMFTQGAMFFITLSVLLLFAVVSSQVWVFIVFPTPHASVSPL